MNPDCLQKKLERLYDAVAIIISKKNYIKKISIGSGTKVKKWIETKLNQLELSWPTSIGKSGVRFI